MKSFIVAVLAALTLAGCSNGDSGGNAGATAASAPVAAKAAPAGQSWTDTVVKTAEGYRVGNPDAPVKVIEYGSRLCPTCGAFAREGYEPLMKNYVNTGKVSLEFREFLVHGAPDLPPSLLGTCVPPATFFPLLEAMYVNQQGFKRQADRHAGRRARQAQDRQAGRGGRHPRRHDGAWSTFVKQRGLPEGESTSLPVRHGPGRPADQADTGSHQ